MKLLSLFIMLSFLVAANVYAGNPPPLFNKPVKLDDSGRPLYNSFERYEYERKQRLKRRSLSNSKKQITSPTPVIKTVVKPSSQTPTAITSQSSTKDSDKSAATIPHNGSTKNSATSVPTPSSVIINRPVYIKGDPNSDDLNF